MKVGKHHRRFGRPSEKFLEKKRQEDQVNIKTPPVEGDVKVFLDDERPCPKGWTLARYTNELWELFHPVRGVSDRITLMSLDWYLGSGMPDGIQVVESLVEEFQNNPNFLPKLEEIYFHSSDHGKAGEMCRAVFKGLPEHRKYDILLHVGNCRG